MRNSSNHYNITVLLTIFNRLNFSKKWLDYAEQQNLPFKIFISDGGSIKNIKTKLNLDSRKLDIQYKKFKFYKNYKKIYEKYFYAIKNIKTKYVLIAEDDDYINIEGFIKSAKFLDKNKSYYCIKGVNCLGELIFNNNKCLSLSLRNENCENSDISLKKKNSEDRLISFYKNKNISIFNGLFKTNAIKDAFEILGKRDFYNLYITELILNLAIINIGKVKRENYIDYVKMDNTQFSSSRNFINIRPFSKIIKSQKFDEENNLIFNYLRFSSPKKSAFFKKLYESNLTRDSNIRLKEEKIYNSFTRMIRDLVKKFLVNLNIYYLIKNFYLYFKSKTVISPGIFVLNNSIITASKKNVKFFESILSFNKN
jgi:glycosyltransferase domain-containing protein